MTWPAAHASDLTQMSLEQLMDLRVVGASKYEQKQSEVAAAVSVLTRNDIRSFGWRTLDEALASLPGIHTSYDRQYSYIGTRGFGLPGDYNTRLLVTINGNRVNDSVYDTGPTGQTLGLDLDLIERIEYIPGPGGAVYGQNAMFGVVNIVTRSGSSINGFEVAASNQRPGSRREARLSFGRKFDNGLDLLVSASALKSRGEDRWFDYGAAGVTGVAAGLDGARDREVFVHAALGGWSFTFTRGHARKDDPTAAYLSDPLVPGQYQGDRHTLAQVQYERSFLDDRLQLQARVFGGQERFDSQLNYGTPYLFPATGDWQGAELRLLYTGIAGHKLLVGVEAQDHPTVEQQIIDVADRSHDVTILSPGWRHGVYVQDEWQLGEQLIATVGLRVDRNSSTGTRISPRAALIWRTSPATTLKALAGRASRAPNAYERDYDDGISQLGNPALKGERIDTLELVADHRISSDLALRGAAYQWAMRDLVTLGLEPTSGIPQYQSGSTVRAKGLELAMDKTWSWGGRLRASVSWQHLRDDAGNRLVNSPQRLGKLGLSVPLPWAGLRLGYEWQADSARLTEDGSETGGYALSNLHLSTDRLAPGLELALTVRNLFDKRYSHPGADINWQNAFEQDGRSVRLTARYRF